MPTATTNRKEVEPSGSTSAGEEVHRNHQARLLLPGCLVGGWQRRMHQCGATRGVAPATLSSAPMACLLSTLFAGAPVSASAGLAARLMVARTVASRPGRASLLDEDFMGVLSGYERVERPSRDASLSARSFGGKAGIKDRLDWRLA